MYIYICIYMHEYTHIQTYCILHNRHTCIQTFMTVTQIRHKHTCTRAYDYIVTDHKGSHTHTHTCTYT